MTLICCRCFLCQIFSFYFSPLSSSAITTMAENRCWICLVDKTDDDDNAWSTPCSCSLIAHKECLLVWVQSKLSDDADSPVQCPQCGERYRIVTRTPPLLRPLRSADKLLRRISPLATVAGGWRRTRSARTRPLTPLQDSVLAFLASVHSTGQQWRVQS